MISTWFLMAALSSAAPQATASDAPDSLFDPPVRLTAGEKPMGEKRMYPSPVVFDIDGDGKPEMVIGDLWGNLTVCEREGDGWADAKPLEGADGNALKFNNW